MHTTQFVNPTNKSEHQLVHGDCVQLMDCLLQNSIWADLVFADPPFNIDHGYDVYHDALDAHDFRRWYRTWFLLACRILRPSGVLVLNVPDALVLPSLSIVAECGEMMRRVDWCIWHYRFGQCISAATATKFISSHTHCLVFSRAPCAYTFNGMDVLVPSDRATKYADPRIYDSATGGERIPLDVWCNDNDGPNWGRVQGNSTERVGGHPNQLPENYLARIIRAYTHPGEFVVDPFGGTWTTGVVASALGRHSMCSDISSQYVQDGFNRLQKGAVRL